METKICTKCGLEFPATTEYFHRKKTGKYGLRADCKKCCNERHKTYREEHSEELKKYQKVYRETHKEERRQYHKEYSPKYYQNNKESINKRHVQYNRKYIKTLHGRELDRAKRYKRKAIDFLNGGSYTPKQWRECLLYFDNKCAYTGEPLKPNNTHVEHIVPISKGGTNYIWNICPSIGYANLSKNDNDMEEWYRKQTYFNEERLQKIYSWIEYAKFMF